MPSTVRASRPYRSHVARLFVDHARRCGVEPGRPLGRGERERERAGIVLRFEALCELADALARAAGDPYFGISAAAHLPRGAYGIVEYAVASAATVGDALAVGLRCHALSSELARVAIRRDGERVTFEHWVDHGAAARAVHGNEFALATYLEIGARAIGARPRFHAVRFMHHGSTARRAALERHFEAPVELGADRNALVLDDELLATPIASADPALFEILTAHAHRDLARASPRHDLAGEIRATYRRMLVDTPHAAQAHDVAHALALSTRSLNRRLAEAGTSFRAIDAQVKRELSLEYLRDGGRPIAEVARLVGFAEPSAFVRAFKRWTGEPPSAVRERLRAEV